MEFLLSKVTNQAMNYAIRSGISITSGYAISQCARLLKTKDGRHPDELDVLQKRLETKIRIISPAIDMIELISARGNSSLESAVTLTKIIRWEIQVLGVRLSKAAAEEELSRSGSSKAKSQTERDSEMKRIVLEMTRLLERIEDAVPLINLAITTSGVSLSSSLPASISPSRLLQASTFLSAGDAHYAANPKRPAQVGPSFTLSMYMLFRGHAQQTRDEENLRKATWKEVMHKAKVKIIRTSIDEVGELASSSSSQEREEKPENRDADDWCSTLRGKNHSQEFAYQLSIIEDLDDGRLHIFEEDEAQPGPFDDVHMAGVRAAVPIHEVSKIFYADTGKILNIGSDSAMNNPILLLKRDPKAPPPRRMVEREPAYVDAALPSEYESSKENSKQSLPAPSQDAPELPNMEQRQNSRISPWQLPSDLDPEWIALEVFANDNDADDDEFETEGNKAAGESTQQADHALRKSFADVTLSSALSNIEIMSSASSVADNQKTLISTDEMCAQSQRGSSPLAHVSMLPIRTTLSLLEMLIRLTSLQQFQQASHLTINDELLNFFLEESSTTGAASGDAEAKKRIRMDARQRVGFDPYDESPIKRRGEHHQYSRDEESTYPTWHHWMSSGASREQTRNDAFVSPMLSSSFSPDSVSCSGTPQREVTGLHPSSGKETPLDIRHSKRRNAPLVTPPDTTGSTDAFLKREQPKAGTFPSSPLAGIESRSREIWNPTDGGSPGR